MIIEADKSRLEFVSYILLKEETVIAGFEKKEEKNYFLSPPKIVKKYKVEIHFIDGYIEKEKFDTFEDAKNYYNKWCL